MKQSSLFSVHNARILIVGGTAGIGLGLATHLCREGANVIVAGRRAEGAVAASSVGASFVRMDVTRPASIARALLSITKQWPASQARRIDSLILNAGVDLPVGTISTLDSAAFKRTFEVNVMGTMLVLQACVSHMARGASIVVTSSPASVNFSAGIAAYAASKAALNALVRCWAAELSFLDIRVNAVMPGLVKSEIVGSGHGALLRAFTLGDHVRESGDLGGVYQFLISRASAPITATILAADDGMSGTISPNVFQLMDEGLHARTNKINAEKSTSSRRVKSAR